MDKQFRGYIPYKEKDYKDIWTNSIIVIDTNVILNFYRYSDETRKELWKILEDLKQRLWMPYQVAYEYFKNRENVIQKVENSLNKIEDEISKNLENSKNNLQEVDKKSINCKKQIIEILEEANKKIKDLIENEKSQQEHFGENDSILEKIQELFNGKCEKKVSDDELKQIKAEAERREELKIPPGYKDNKKQENYGDYYIFYSIQKQAKKEKKNVIFVTDDEKQDWYLKTEGKSKGGRPELLNEFFESTNQMLYICTTKMFLKSYGRFSNGIQAPRNVIKEIEDIQKNEEKESFNREMLLAKRRMLINNNKTINNSKLYDKILNLRTYLLLMKQRGVINERYVKKFEEEINQILEDMNLEPYHGKFLVILDELERDGVTTESIRRTFDLVTRLFGKNEV